MLSSDQFYTYAKGGKLKLNKYVPPLCFHTLYD